MSTLQFDLNKKGSGIKVMHAVNNGPAGARKTQKRGNFQAYMEARIPYARNHDAAHWSGIGGEHVVDIHGIFPDFSKDPLDPASYDFLLTDKYLEKTVDAGTVRQTDSCTGQLWNGAYRREDSFCPYR